MQPDSTKEKMSYRDILPGIDRILHELRSSGIELGPDNQLIRMRDLAFRVIEAYDQGNSWGKRSELKQGYIALLGLGEIIRLYNQAKKVDPHLLRIVKLHAPLLGHAGFGPIVDAADGDASRKIFELSVGLAAIAAFSNVKLEDPNHSDPKNPNPDLIVEFNGDTIGIACKSLFTTDSNGLIANVKKAVGQIEFAKNMGRVRRGLVLLDVSSLIVEDEWFYAPHGQYWDPRWHEEDTRAMIESCTAKLESNVTKNQLWKIFSGSSAFPCIAYYAHAAGLSMMADGVAPTIFKGILINRLNDMSEVNSLLLVLNKAILGQL